MHKVDAPFASETGDNPNLWQIGPLICGECRNCGARLVADGQDGCTGSEGRPDTRL
jgi:hypothetical protein